MWIPIFPKIIKTECKQDVSVKIRTQIFNAIIQVYNHYVPAE